MEVLMMLLLASLSGSALAAPVAETNDDSPGMTAQQAATSTQQTAKPEGLQRAGRALLHRGPDRESDG